MKLTGWAPSNLTFKGERPFLEWTWVGEQSFTKPSYEDEIAAALCHPFALLFRQEMPLANVEEMEFIEPTGFIFHISHCGSTLITQMLSTLPDAVVLSESPIIDCVLQAWRKIPGVTHEERLQWLRWSIRAHGQPRTGGETRYFLKLDSWHIHDFLLIREAFPATPWIFVFRDPAEAIASQLTTPCRQATPGIMDPQILGLTFLDFQLPREEWCARVLEKICDSALSQKTGTQGLFVGYDQLPEAVWTKIAPHFGLPLDENEIERMRHRTALPVDRPPHDVSPALKQAYEAMQGLAQVAEIAAFLESVGLPVRFCEITEQTFLPGVAVDRGVLTIDRNRLLYPGDLLHEAGHLALLPSTERAIANGHLGDDGGFEMAAIAWSWAAAKHLQIDPAVVFHEEGYRGGASALRENFQAGRYIGVPLLVWAGLTTAADYPVLSSWLRD